MLAKVCGRQKVNKTDLAVQEYMCWVSWVNSAIWLRCQWTAETDTAWSSAIVFPCPNGSSFCFVLIMIQFNTLLKYELFYSDLGYKYLKATNKTA